MWVHFHTKMVYDGLKSMFPDEVPVTLARSGWTGTQRYIDPFYFFTRFVFFTQNNARTCCFLRIFAHEMFKHTRHYVLSQTLSVLQGTVHPTGTATLTRRGPISRRLLPQDSTRSCRGLRGGPTTSVRCIKLLRTKNLTNCILPTLFVLLTPLFSLPLLQLLSALSFTLFNSLALVDMCTVFTALVAILLSLLSIAALP